MIQETSKETAGMRRRSWDRLIHKQAKRMGAHKPSREDLKLGNLTILAGRSEPCPLDYDAAVFALIELSTNEDSSRTLSYKESEVNRKFCESLFADAANGGGLLAAMALDCNFYHDSAFNEPRHILEILFSRYVSNTWNEKPKIRLAHGIVEAVSLLSFNRINGKVDSNSQSAALFNKYAFKGDTSNHPAVLLTSFSSGGVTPAPIFSLLKAASVNRDFILACSTPSVLDDKRSPGDRSPVIVNIIDVLVKQSVRDISFLTDAARCTTALMLTTRDVRGYLPEPKATFHSGTIRHYSLAASVGQAVRDSAWRPGVPREPHELSAIAVEFGNAVAQGGGDFYLNDDLDRCHPDFIASLRARRESTEIAAEIAAVEAERLSSGVADGVPVNTRKRI